MSIKKDLTFLKKYPNINDWLNINGYTVIYTSRDVELGQIITTWSDRTTKQTGDNHTDAQNFLTIIYCEECKNIEIYKRVALCSIKQDKEMVVELSECLPGTL